jgi:hypothetical protein
LALHHHLRADAGVIGARQPQRKEGAHAALARGKVDWPRKHEHYGGPLTREALLSALDDKQRQLLATLETVDINAPIDWGGTPFTFALFTWEFVQHEAIHHGQWSVYYSLAGFDTPLSWRVSWGL